MSPGAIIALIKDGLIVIAVAVIFYFVVNYGEDIVKLKDVQGLKLQLQDNATHEARWREEQINADTQRDKTVKQLADAIAGQRAPVYVLRDRPAGAGAVSGHPAQASGTSAGTGGADPGRGSDRQPVDVRPQVNQFELKYETALADCRGALAKWPTPPP